MVITKLVAEDTYFYTDLRGVVFRTYINYIMLPPSCFLCQVETLLWFNFEIENFI